MLLLGSLFLLDNITSLLRLLVFIFFKAISRGRLYYLLLFLTEGELGEDLLLLFLIISLFFSLSLSSLSSSKSLLLISGFVNPARCLALNGLAE